LAAAAAVAAAAATRRAAAPRGRCLLAEAPDVLLQPLHARVRRLELPAPAPRLAVSAAGAAESAVTLPRKKGQKATPGHTWT